MQIPDSECPGGYLAYEIAAESRRFGRKVRRYVLAGPDAGPMADAIASDKVDLAIVRIPTDQLGVVNDLSNRFDSVLLADCLVVYTRENVRSGVPDPPRNGHWILQAATVDDGQLLDSMTEQVFANYSNHYSANPDLHGFKLGDAYKEWVGSHVTESGRGCFIARISGTPVGFATVRLGEDEGEGVLYGVLPEHQGRGVYRDLIRSTVREFMERGYVRTLVSTQVDNRAVQRVWASERFSLTHSYFTIHINRPSRT